MEKRVLNYWFERLMQKFRAPSCHHEGCDGIRTQELRLNGEVNRTEFVCCMRRAEEIAGDSDQVLISEHRSRIGGGRLFARRPSVVYTCGERRKYQT